MTHEAKVHPIQTTILRSLLLSKEAGYAELQKDTNLESDHFKFHIARLVEIGYVIKLPNKKYGLTTKGKEYSNKLDTDNNVIERQPKIAVMLYIEHDDGRILMQERLKHPYFGFWGYPTGKIRWGETILQTAARELDEETGLMASLEYKGVYHEHAVSEETGELLEDKVFHVVKCTDPKGDLKVEFEGGRNQWLTMAEFETKENTFADSDIAEGVQQSYSMFIEREQLYPSAKF